MKVAVIGAGLAGLTVARGCHNLGFSVDVFDKAQGLGGRLAHKRLPWGTLDLGAQYFTARDRQFRQEVDLWTKLGIAQRWQFEPSRVENGQLTPSPDDTERFTGYPTMNQIAHEVAVGATVHLRRRVSAVVRTQTHADEPPLWRLLFDEGTTGGKVVETGGYDWLVTGLPAEQTRALLADCGLASAIAEQVMEPCWAVALATRGEVAASIEGIFGDDTVSWVSRQTDRLGASDLQQPRDYDDLWVVHFTAQWSLSHGKHTQENLPQTALEWLRRALRVPLELVHCHQHFWRYARGHQSTPDGQRFLVDAEQQVAAVGDWLSGGRVEGAWLSAQALVDQVLSAAANAREMPALGSGGDWHRLL